VLVVGRDSHFGDVCGMTLSNKDHLTFFVCIYLDEFVTATNNKVFTTRSNIEAINRV
jgi:hypothetical protein